MICIRNGNIHDVITGKVFQADILTDAGKIKAIGTDFEVPEDARIIDASGKEIYPGFVEAHGHIGLDGYGIGNSLAASRLF